MDTAWNYDWRSQIDALVSKLGYDNVRSFVYANPGVPLGQLYKSLIDAAEINSAPIAFIQFLEKLFSESKKDNCLRFAVADSLVRSLRKNLRAGWNKGKRIIERRANTRSEWYLPPSDYSRYSELANRVWARLTESAPPDDWCPISASDEIIQQVFNTVWPD
ncbi:MAG: hypothetical protein JSS02_31195 [Planctomycetes bacterium]|nr:hypothetical protein [Planctomycetota bacterium]